MKYVRALGPDDRAAFAAWRRACRPQRVGARSFDAVASKYWEHPSAALCPGSGLYAYDVDGEILGVIGAYPFPVLWHDRRLPGHALVDWAVLPRLRGSVVGGKLFQFGLSLPGRKFGIGGGPDSLPTLVSRARRVPVRHVTTVREPLRVAAAMSLGLLADAGPASTAPPPDATGVEVPSVEDGACATAAHAPDFVAHLARDAHLTGVEVWTCGAPAGAAVVAVRGRGSFRGLHVLAAGWDGGIEKGRAFGSWMRKRIRDASPAYVAAYETAATRASGLLALRGPKRRREDAWWVFPPAGDDGIPADAEWTFRGLDTDQLW